MQNTRPEMLIFQLLRDEDKSGVSGVGLVAFGAIRPFRAVPKPGICAVMPVCSAIPLHSARFAWGGAVSP